MGVLYEHLAQAVPTSAPPVLVVSGDCTTTLGVLAGLQRAGRRRHFGEGAGGRHGFLERQAPSGR
jgi:arginase family enzyme